MCKKVVNNGLCALFSVLTLLGTVSSRKLTLDILSPTHKDTIAQLRKYVKSLKLELTPTQMEDDLYLARWLAAKNFNVDDTLESLKRDSRWRRNHGINRILEENWNEMERDYPYEIVEEDKLGRPLLYIKFGQWNISRMSTTMHISDLGRYFTKIMEEADNKVWEARAKGENVSQFTILLDVQGYEMRKHACFHCLGFYSGLGETLQSHYPRIAERLVIINALPMFEAMFDTLQRVLQIDARSSIEIFGPNRRRWETALLEFLEPSQFPRDLRISPNHPPSYNNVADYDDTNSSHRHKL